MHEFCRTNNTVFIVTVLSIDTTIHRLSFTKARNFIYYLALSAPSTHAPGVGLAARTIIHFPRQGEILFWVLVYG
jgi:hypothetical protein